MNKNVMHFDSVQAAFDYMVGEVIKQGRPSVVDPSADEDTTCSYRGHDGTKCALGHIISDELAARCNVGFSAYDLIDKGEFLAEDVAPGMTDELLAQVQRAHDRAWIEEARWSDTYDYVRQFKFRAKTVADWHGLTWNHGEV